MDIKKIIISLAMTSLGSIVQAAHPADLDGDGRFSLEELQEKPGR